jgi:hypothetical protein
MINDDYGQYNLPQDDEELPGETTFVSKEERTIPLH